MRKIIIGFLIICMGTISNSFANNTNTTISNSKNISVLSKEEPWYDNWVVGFFSGFIAMILLASITSK